MPPVLLSILSLPVWTGYTTFWPGGAGHAMASGSFFGYVCYDLMHCKVVY